MWLVSDTQLLHFGVYEPASVFPAAFRFLSCILPLQLRQYHQSWLCDLSVRLLCVVTLDRFADYVSDQVRKNYGFQMSAHRHECHAT